MGNRQDDRNSCMGSRNDGRQAGGGPESGGGSGRGRQGGPPPPRRGEPGRSFGPGEDMGGSSWSGASGRGGYYAPDRPTESGYDRYNGYGRYAHEGGYSGDREYANVGGAGYATEGSHEDHDEGSFLTEDSPGHVPNQRWSGGYGGDRDREREREGYGPSGPPSGRGFTGNDFGGLPRRRDRAYGAPADLGPRHFGNEVDRGGRMGPGGSSTTGRGYWGWESDRASGINMGTMGGREGYNRESGYGFHGTDMGMGAPEEDRGPHYGKGPKGYKRSDDRTREDVCDAIAHQGHIDASDVEVKVADGIVTLSGTVGHRKEKRRLEHLVEQCRGVHEVHNELRLKRAEATNETKAERQDEPKKQERAGEIADGSSNGNRNGKSVRS
jgi:BON domain-containing protein